jgi:hypothetical protein
MKMIENIDEKNICRHSNYKEISFVANLAIPKI